MWFGEREGRTRGAGMIEKTYFCVCSCALSALALEFILNVFYVSTRIGRSDGVRRKTGSR